MTLPLPSGPVVTFSSECLWPAVVLVILAVIIAPAIWSRGYRQRAAMAVIMIVLDTIATIAVATRRSLSTWRNPDRRTHSQEPGHHDCRPVPAPPANRPPYSEDPIGSHRTRKIRVRQDVEDQRPLLNDVNRRGAFGGAATLTVSALLPQGVVAAGRIDPADTAQCWTALRCLHELDAQRGGATVYQLAVGMSHRLQDALRRGSYPPVVGAELRRVTAVTMEQAGWLAYDAGWLRQAQRWWLEACHLADLADVPEARVRALASMALQASGEPDRGLEAVALAQAARTAAQAQGEATPALLSLLAAREACGHAMAGDRAAATSCVAQARRWLDHGRRGDEPFWLNFWGPADLAWHEVEVNLITKNGRSAESAARAALATVDADAFSRNHILYSVRLGSVLAQRGQLDEAITVTSDALQRVDIVRGSGRIVSGLRHTVDLLGQQNYPPARTLATVARQLLPVQAYRTATRSE